MRIEKRMKVRRRRCRVLGNAKSSWRTQHSPNEKAGDSPVSTSVIHPRSNWRVTLTIVLCICQDGAHPTTRCMTGVSIPVTMRISELFVRPMSILESPYARKMLRSTSRTRESGSQARLCCENHCGHEMSAKSITQVTPRQWWR